MVLLWEKNGMNAIFFFSKGPQSSIHECLILNSSLLHCLAGYGWLWVDDVVLHLQDAHPVRPVRPRALRQDLLHAGTAGACPSLNRLETRGGGTLKAAQPHTGVQPPDIPFVTTYFYGTAPRAFYTSWLNSKWQTGAGGRKQWETECTSVSL